MAALSQGSGVPQTNRRFCHFHIHPKVMERQDMVCLIYGSVVNINLLSGKYWQRTLSNWGFVDIVTTQCKTRHVWPTLPHMCNVEIN